MVKVYFEKGGYAELVATFATDELYEACYPALNARRKKLGFTKITETLEAK